MHRELSTIAPAPLEERFRSVPEAFCGGIVVNSADSSHVLDVHEGPCVVRFSPRGQILVAGHIDGRLSAWSVGKNARFIGRAQSDESVLDVLFSPRLSVLVTRGPRRLCGWRVPDLERSFEIEAESDGGAVFSSDGWHVCVAAGRSLALQDLREKRVVCEGLLPTGNAVDVGTAPGGKLAVASSEGGRTTLSLWLCEDGTLRQEGEAVLEGDSRTVSLSGDGRLLSVSAQHVRVLETPFFSGASRAECGGGPTERVLAGAIAGAGAVVFDSQRLVESKSNTVSRNGSRTRSWCRSVFSADGRLLVGGSPSGRIFLWDLVRRASIRVLDGHEGEVTSVDMLHGQAMLSSCGADGSIRLWDLKQTRR